MSETKSLYIFHNDDQYLEIEFLKEKEMTEASLTPHSWFAYVFDDNWSEIISTAGTVSEIMARSIEYVYEIRGIRGRIAVLSGLDPNSLISISDALETSLFQLQALLSASAIIVYEDVQSSLDNFGFTKEDIGDGEFIYMLASDDVSNDSCRFL